MRVHDIQRHLSRIKLETILFGYLKHVQVYEWIFVTCEPDVANLPGGACFNERCVRSLFIKDAVRIFKSNDFMVLDQIDVVDTQTPQ
jgi:hypothetical protein